MICRHCGTHQRGQHRLPGSGWIEAVLWLAWVVPGMLYSIWRRTAAPVCIACSRAALVDDVSPLGRQLLREHYPGGAPMPLPPTPPAKANPIVHWTTVALLTFLGAIALGTLGLLAFR